MKYFIILFLILNTFLSAQSYITIPDKNTNDQFTAAELNQILDAIKDGALSIQTASITINGIDYTAIATPSSIIDSTLIYNVYNYGATGNGIANDATAIQSCIDAITDSNVTIMGDGNWILANVGDTKQLDLSNKKNLTFRLTGTLKLDDDIQTDGGGAVQLIYGEDCSGLNLDLKGLTIDGNASGQSGWTGGYGSGNNGSGVLIKGNSDTVRNVFIEGGTFQKLLGEAIRVEKFVNVNISHASIDTCGEGILVVSGNHFNIHHNTIKTTMAQDGIEPSSCKWGFIHHNIFNDTTEYGGQIDIFNSDYIDVSNNFMEWSDIQLTGTTNLWLHDNTFKRFGSSEANIVLNSTANSNIYIYKNNFYPTNGGRAIDIQGEDIVIDARYYIYQNNFFLEGVSNYNAFRIYGYGCGVKITANNIYGVADQTHYGLNLDDAYSNTPNNWYYVDNKHFNTVYGLVFSAGARDLDSMHVVDNTFTNTLPYNIFYSSTSNFINPIIGKNSFIKNNGTYPYVHSDNLVVGEAFAPIGGLPSYYLQSNIDSISIDSKLGEMEFLTFTCRGTTTDTLKDGKNIFLSGNNFFKANQYDVIVLQKQLSGVGNVQFVEISRSEN